jgi:EAL and modified HD-GYP domain-containing signal transduction protein
MLQMPMEKIFEEIQINEDVQGALLKHTGELGKILKLVMAIEKFDLPQAEKILEEIKISNEEFSHILQKGYERD